MCAIAAYIERTHEWSPAFAARAKATVVPDITGLPLVAGPIQWQADPKAAPGSQGHASDEAGIARHGMGIGA